MHISHSTLNAIASLLRAEGVPSVDTDKLSDVLDTMISAREDVALSVQLKAGEIILVRDGYGGNDIEEFDNVTSALEYIKDHNSDRGHGDDVSDWSVYVARLLSIEAEQKLTITIK